MILVFRLLSTGIDFEHTPACLDFDSWMRCQSFNMGRLGQTIHGRLEPRAEMCLIGLFKGYGAII
jgi:hypothetical protein